MKAFVLAYHSHNISGTDYARNDHLALQADLETIDALGLRIVPLAEIAKLVRERRFDGHGELVVGLSFDDGPLFDYADFVHPRFGPQKSFFNILREFRDRHRASQPSVNATSFVIASAAARRAMERAPDCGFPEMEGWLADAWWEEAAASGLLDIGNHSWDHVHHAVDAVALPTPERDSFYAVDTYPVADAQVRRAADYINSRCGNRCRLFAYPFGHSAPFLVNEYFPEHPKEHGMIAAFGATGGVVDGSTSVWDIPRAVCGHHWHSTHELRVMVAA